MPIVDARRINTTVYGDGVNAFHLFVFLTISWLIYLVPDPVEISSPYLFVRDDPIRLQLFHQIVQDDLTIVDLVAGDKGDRHLVQHNKNSLRRQFTLPPMFAFWPQLLLIFFKNQLDCFARSPCVLCWLASVYLPFCTSAKI